MFMEVVVTHVYCCIIYIELVADQSHQTDSIKTAKLSDVKLLFIAVTIMCDNITMHDQSFIW